MPTKSFLGDVISFFSDSGEAFKVFNTYALGPDKNMPSTDAAQLIVHAFKHDA
jgi:hypothetical protein